MKPLWFVHHSHEQSALAALLVPVFPRCTCDAMCTPELQAKSNASIILAIPLYGMIFFTAQSSLDGSGILLGFVREERPS